MCENGCAELCFLFSLFLFFLLSFSLFSCCYSLSFTFCNLLLLLSLYSIFLFSFENEIDEVNKYCVAVNLSTVGNFTFNPINSSSSFNGLCPLVCSHSELIWKYGSYGQLVGLLGRKSGRRRAATYMGKHKHIRKADIHPCIECNSNPRSQCSSGLKYFTAIGFQ
jgi:hypothetical protein